MVEGAGAVGVAALIAGQVKPSPKGATVAILSGGNVDAALLAAVARHHETVAGRRLVVFTRVPDRPGSLARLLARVAGGRRQPARRRARARGRDPARPRDRRSSSCSRRAGPTHAAAVLDAIRAEGYEARVVR